MGPERRGRRQCGDEVRHEQVLGKRVSLSAQRRAQCQLVLPQHGPETPRSTAHRRDSDTTTSGTRSAGPRFQAARSCSSSSRRSGDGAPATKRSELGHGSGSGVADRSRQSQLCPARGARPECGEAADPLAGAERSRDQSTIGPRSRNELDTRQEFVRADYNVSTNWSLTGRYLHDQVDSRGEYVTDAGPRARSSLSGRPPRRGGGPARTRTALARILVPVVDPRACPRKTGCTPGATSGF